MEPFENLLTTIYLKVGQDQLYRNLSFGDIFNAFIMENRAKMQLYFCWQSDVIDVYQIDQGNKFSIQKN